MPTPLPRHNCKCRSYPLATPIETSKYCRFRSVFYLHSGNYGQWQRLNVSPNIPRHTELGGGEGESRYTMVQLANLGALRARRTLHLCRFNGRVWLVRSRLSPSRRCKLSLSENTSNLRRINQTRDGQRGVGRGEWKSSGELPYQQLAILSASKQRAHASLPPALLTSQNV